MLIGYAWTVFEDRSSRSNAFGNFQLVAKAVQQGFLFDSSQFRVLLGVRVEFGSSP